MSNFDLSADERDLIVMGLNMRICNIETGSPILRSNDAINQGQHKLIKPLDEGQRAVIARSEALIRKVLSAC